MARTSRSPFVQRMEDGAFWVEETPVGSVNGSNKTFTLSYSPNPASSLELEVQGQTVIPGGVDFTLVDDTITTVAAYPAGVVLRARYRMEPT